MKALLEQRLSSELPGLESEAPLISRTFASDSHLWLDLEA